MGQCGNWAWWASVETGLMGQCGNWAYGPGETGLMGQGRNWACGPSETGLMGQCGNWAWWASVETGLMGQCGNWACIPYTRPSSQRLEVSLSRTNLRLGFAAQPPQIATPFRQALRLPSSPSVAGDHCYHPVSHRRPRRPRARRRHRYSLATVAPPEANVNHGRTTVAATTRISFTQHSNAPKPVIASSAHRKRRPERRIPWPSRQRLRLLHHRATVFLLNSPGRRNLTSSRHPQQQCFVSPPPTPLLVSDFVCVWVALGWDCKGYGDVMLRGFIGDNNGVVARGEIRTTISYTNRAIPSLKQKHYTQSSNLRRNKMLTSWSFAYLNQLPASSDGSFSALCSSQ
ncbi:hypothetical protein V8G54_027955 [Vigna mungo]|uniref:Uncharacterized protein n=1 Tax=Vigna mungo TaxID=3915 RepID=A0AAQ3MSH6_VIGMU